jgi:hypothetical protein
MGAPPAGDLIHGLPQASPVHHPTQAPPIAASVVTRATSPARRAFPNADQGGGLRGCDPVPIANIRRRGLPAGESGQGARDVRAVVTREAVGHGCTLRHAG